MDTLYMSQATVVSRRVQDCITRLQSGNYEGALIDLFPALDKTAQKRRPTLGVGKRIRSFIDDEEFLLLSLTTGRPMTTRVLVNDISIADAIYKLGRCAILHEGELDPKLKFTNSGIIEIGIDIWHFPVSYITAMTIAVISAPENSKERIEGSLKISFFGAEFGINELWGKKQEIGNLIFGS